VIFAAALGAILMLGVLDQTSDRFIPRYGVDERAYRTTGAFVATLQRTLPPGSSVFQLPIVEFPEVPRPDNQVGAYENARLYIQSHGLRWSFGAVKGRPSDWQAALMPGDLHQILRAATVTGFDGIEVDRDAYSDYATGLVAQLGQTLAEQPLVSSDGRYVFFDLRRYRSLQLARLTTAQLVAARDSFLYAPQFGSGFYAPETITGQISHWESSSGQLVLTNPGRRTQPVSLGGVAFNGFAQPSHVTVIGAGGPQTFPATMLGSPFSITLSLRSGATTLTFANDAPRVVAPTDPRDLRVRISQLSETLVP
jgi:hypothetical protein